jgi:hypothetical protein
LGSKALYCDIIWLVGFAALLRFNLREGHCRVPRRHVEQGYRLGQWVAVQRYTRSELSPRRRAQLNEAGFVWSGADWLWESGFAALKAFRDREGHGLVPTQHIEDKLKLGLWVSTQRRKNLWLASERRRRLEDIGFVWRVGRGKTRQAIAPRSGDGAESSHQAWERVPI